FVLGCVAVYAAFSVLLPPYFALIEPDSIGYLGFYADRTAVYPLFLRGLLGLGLDAQQITYVQLLLFAVALVPLLLALLRASVPRWLIVLFVVLLGANGYFSSFHRTIMTESLYFSVMVVGIALTIDYLRSGRVEFLAGSGLCTGLLIAIRPAGVVLLPMLLIAAWLKWRRRNLTGAVFAAALVVPVAIGPAAEWLAFRAVHGDNRQSIVPHILFGKAAM